MACTLLFKYYCVDLRTYQVGTVGRSSAVCPVLAPSGAGSYILVYSTPRSPFPEEP